MSSPLDSTTNGVGSFKTTHWSVVLKAAQQNSLGAEEALNALCQAYRYPIYAFIRRRGHTHHEAEDLAHEFFARLLEKNFLEGITVEGGKFRSFLLTLLKHSLANQWHREHAQKRGGGIVFVSLDEKSGDVEARYAREPMDTATPDALYERRWAMTVLDRVLDRLRAEYVATRKSEWFEALQGHLSGVERLVPYVQLAVRLRTSEGAIKTAVHRLRKRYGELLRAEIAGTVSDPTEVEEEIRNLICVMTR